MENFGKARGNLAHQSIGTQQPLDPSTVFNDVQSIIIGLRELDEIILSIS